LSKAELSVPELALIASAINFAEFHILRPKFRMRLKCEVSPDTQGADRMAKIGSRNAPSLVIAMAIGGNCEMANIGFIRNAE